MSPFPAAIRAFGPVAVTVLAVGLAWLTGLSQRTVLPAAIEARFYGFFLDRYPLFCAALVYGVARLLLGAARPGPAGPVRRLVGSAIAIVLLLAVCLYPTFGGGVLRAGFATGGMAFLTGQTMPIAYGLGAAAVALVFGLALGLGGLLAIGAPRGNARWARRLRLGVGRMLTRTLALWFAFGILGLATAAGLGPWPHRPLAAGEAGLAVALVLLAFLPHASLDWLDSRAAPQSHGRTQLDPGS